jgi:hypothetical protein
MGWHVVAGLIVIIVSVCTCLDWVLTDKEKKMDPARLSMIGLWNQLDDFSLPEAIRASSAVFNDLFDTIYGKRPFSLRRIGMSVVTSIVAIGTSSFVYLASNHVPVFHEFGAMFLPLLLEFNLVVDFVSLNKTRFLLRKSEKTSNFGLVGLLALDLVLTIALYALPLASIFDIKFALEVISGRAEYMAPVFFVAAFAASLLFYLFLACTLFLKVLDLSRSRLMILLEQLSASDNLFKSAGALLSALLAAGKGVTEIVSAFTSKK